MKKILLLVLLSVVAIPYYIYGQDDTHVTVHVGEERLSDLLTEEQKSSVTHLKVTGTLKGEDYAFLRENMLKNLKELNLRDTDIDTIPERAFKGMQSAFLLVLPFNIKHIGDDAIDFWMGVYLEVTGHFPTKGKSCFMTYWSWYIVSEDNPYCEVRRTKWGDAIYSTDGKTLFYLPILLHDLYEYEQRIEDGTKIIHATAFRYMMIEDRMNLVFPSSLDSIGDYAFARTQICSPTYLVSSPYPHGPNNKDCGNIICEAIEPPKLGNCVWGDDEDRSFSDITDWYLYVPEESIEKYKTAKGWCEFKEIRTIEWLLNWPASMDNVRIIPSSSSYTLHFQKPVRCMDLYTLQGILLESYDLQSMTATVNKTLLSSPYALARVHYADGTAETIKLKP